ncbi:porphobilinogen synthase [Thermoproteus tenax]|uniref:Delta-aminolevulinic acid dehydratase n=1 Tax=Thermoproteus tenax (strain ATCC 35583 / DSM 2078 / JCM 9277 / NBRC 100435 / Kra 1) TaxID=768679 RepID=G4RKT6_THETK|nr:porphobilinogen synthase [Thermoproteus tenax]CCC82181.1 porphobilinogen synthase [Thermoproteus tenax Kra 1]
MLLNLAYPSVRPRRLRANKLIRDAVAETSLSPDDLIMPIFVKEGSSIEHIESMPGYFRWPVGSELVKHVEEALNLGVNKFILFGVLPDDIKDPEGRAGYDPEGVVPKALRLLKETFGDRVLLFADVCLCEYTDHGHCGIVVYDKKGWKIDNDKTISIYAKEAVTYAEAGADFVAPSGMMDGQVRAIRQTLDSAGYTDVGIMAYSAKYASAFYGPFRTAAASAPKFGDRRTYQMDPRNAKEAVKEVMLDLAEGADIVMVKPALAYLDVIRLVKETFPWAPVAAYSVSGEYSMIKAAARAGYLDERLIALETLYAIRRAGADLILTYYARDVALWLKEGTPF